MRRCIVLFFFFASINALSQKEITWKALQDVRFTDKFSEEEQAYYYYPDFGFSVKALEGREVYIKGYMLVIDPKQGVYILSRNPNTACFFCGNGGPESIVELELKPDHPKFKMDQVVTIKGRLVLNQDDLYKCCYILEDAEVYEED
tara:strand:- start:680 stop:1117 length:438 start_codon:yes stop_codon:yes gene_type:complete